MHECSIAAHAICVRTTMPSLCSVLNFLRSRLTRKHNASFSYVLDRVASIRVQKYKKSVICHSTITDFILIYSCIPLFLSLIHILDLPADVQEGPCLQGVHACQLVHPLQDRPGQRRSGGGRVRALRRRGHPQGEEPVDAGHHQVRRPPDRDVYKRQGQNGLIQAKQFKEAAGLTGIVLTKRCV